MTAKVRVSIVGGYANESKHTYDRFATVIAPTPGTEDLTDWWWDEVFPETGDNVYDNSGSYCTATVIEGPAELIGKSNEWLDEGNNR